MAGEVAQGINRQVSYKKQGGKGTPATGSGGQLIRRVTFNPNVTKDTYSSNEIASHQQHTGDTHGIARSAGTLNGELSASTYADFLASLLRKSPMATAAITSLTLTIAADGTNWTITRSAGDFLADGVKKGDVVRLSGSNLNAGNVGVNLIVIDLDATELTVLVPTGSALTAESSKSSSTVSVLGKKIWAPTASHTNDYYTVEDWFSDLAGGTGRSHLYSDMQVGQVDVSMPATGNITANFNFVGLGKRTKGGSRILTTPTAETTTPVLGSVSGVVLIGGTQYAIVTAANFAISGNVNHGEATIGSKFISDTQKGRIMVSGSFSYLFVDDAFAQPFENETVTDLVFYFADDRTDGADFITFVMPEVKLMSDDGDDGEKQIVRSVNFTAQLCSTGGSTAASHKTICSIQDSTLV